MRVRRTNDGLRVQAIAGSYVVLFGIHLPENQCTGLLGFSIHREDHTDHTAGYLQAMKAFVATDPGFPPGSLHSTEHHPIQSFQWADYGAEPGHDYTFRIRAVYGSPTQLDPSPATRIDITTEDPVGGDHDIYFNRGIAGSQAYVHRFGDRAPDDVVPPDAAFAWLSRGLYEALEDFLRSCVPGRDTLRIAAYEFNYKKFLDLVVDVVNAGVDVQIVYDARKDSPRIKNQAAVAAAGLTGVSFERTQPKSYISHNKFIVKLTDDAPVSVWTGGTNFSEGGIYGHSNVAHVVEEPAVAAQFLQYWQALAQDPASTPLKSTVETVSPLPVGKPDKGTTVLFSPRKNLDALDWYAQRAMEAKKGLFMTFAFGMNDVFKSVYENSTADLRFALMEKKTRSMKAGPEKQAEEQKIQNLRNKTANIFAIGDFIRTNNLDGWVKERLTGLNSHVRYVHNKFMLIDPLSNDPIVIAGSANFSDASVRRNDENMVITRGNKRVADVYLGEFMRLFSHHAFRESLQWRDPNDPPKPLRTDNWWQDYFGVSDRSIRREYFARL